MAHVAPTARSASWPTRVGAALLATAVLAALTLTAAQDYRVIGTAEVTYDGIVKRFEAYEVSSEYRVVFTATWETGGFIAEDTWWIDVMMWERDDAASGVREGESMLSFRFFVDPSTGEVVAPTWLHEPDITLIPDYREHYPLYESLAGQTRVTLDELARDGDVIRLRGSATGVLGMVEDYDAEEPDPTRAITLEMTFDLWEVPEIVY